MVGRAWEKLVRDKDRDVERLGDDARFEMALGSLIRQVEAS